MKLLLYIVPLLFLLGLTGADTPYYDYHSCTDTVTSAAANRSYHSSLNSVLSSLSSNSTRTRFHGSSSSVTATGQTIQGLYQCRGDVSLDTCNDCISFATNDLLQRCPNNTGAVIWYDECTLRFSNESIFSAVSTSPAVYMWNPNNVLASEQDQFIGFVRAVLNDNIVQAATEESSFVAGEKSTQGNFSGVDQIYSVVQCTEDLSADDCQSCLQQALTSLPNCCTGRKGGRVLFPSCYFRYEPSLFYNSSGVAPPPPPPPPQPTDAAPSPTPPVPQSGKSGISTAVIMAIVGPVFILLFCVGICFFRRRARKLQHPVYEETATNNFSEEITDVQSLQYDLSTVAAATNNFSEENKLGEGGFGQVFKGTLANGREIAVKRLSRHSGQGAEEFKNEVMLVAKLQHRNLVRLQGFCLEGEEKILVYEFVPNKSLDYFLFDPAKQVLLDWSRRYKIIGGIARGILYLHEDSRLRIIHRDLKASNILLDGDMNPKISDFGMARIFGVDQIQGNTNRIVGTYGYMSPEYAMHGQFSVKSDIYSFGVLVLEIITGRKNNSFYQTDGCDDLISYVWKHWSDGTSLDVLDPIIANSYSLDEVIRCIHIGLLCVQEYPMHRPTMASVVLVLNSYSTTLASPRQPAFFHSRSFQIREWSKSSDQSKTRSIAVSVDDKSITGVYPR